MARAGILFVSIFFVTLSRESLSQMGDREFMMECIRSS